ncbi:MAG: GDP-mannose 4,6-dehydratase [Candidatus Gastranaerophilales bacterium]|nr:GDP-mannose 4,6-dehydratase [Candidatus Gastranaerophilales bacterium]
MERKKALITGITGQDGGYLAELLEGKGYEVFGLKRRVALEDQSARRSFSGTAIPCDITNYGSVTAALLKVMPNEVYHLAAQSDVAYSFKDPFQTLDVNIQGTTNVLEAIRHNKPDAKFYFAGSSEMFGNVLEEPQTEKTPFNPRSPYGISKAAGFFLTKNYREAYNLFACSGILFNHESPRRGKEFVTRKITDAIAKIKAGEQNFVTLGNLDTKRDWGFSKDYVEAMWLMLQQDKPDDYVIATNESHTLEEFLSEAFSHVGLNWKDHVRTDPSFIRPSDVITLRGDYTKAHTKLGWEPKIKFKELVRMMVESDLERLQKR